MDIEIFDSSITSSATSREDKWIFDIFATKKPSALRYVGTNLPFFFSFSGKEDRDFAKELYDKVVRSEVLGHHPYESVFLDDISISPGDSL
jgi:hypothetical protein